jgi:branched-chain amino acid transport system substrate-binding protein
MAVDEINKAGGILGHPIKLIVEDNGSDLALTAAAFNKLANVDSVSAILGPNWAEFSEIVAPLANKNKIAVLSASGYRASLFKPGSYFFSSWTPHQYNSLPLSKLIASKEKEITLLATNNGYHQEIAQIMADQLKSLGVKIVERYDGNPEDRAFRSLAAQLKSKKRGALLLCLLHDGNLAAVLKQIKYINYAPNLYANNAIMSDSWVQANKSVASGLIFFDVPTADSPFTRTRRAQHKESPAPSSDIAYDNVYVLKQALEACSLKDRAALRECLIKTNYHGISGQISFRPDGMSAASAPKSKLYRVTVDGFKELQMP